MIVYVSDAVELRSLISHLDDCAITCDSRATTSTIHLDPWSVPELTWYASTSIRFSLPRNNNPVYVMTNPKIPLITLIEAAHLGDASAEASSPTHDVFRTRVFSTTKKAWPMSPGLSNIAPGTKNQENGALILGFGICLSRCDGASADHSTS